MKDSIRSYTTFTRAERLGLLALGVLLVALIAVRATMYLWVHPAVDEAQNKKLQESWQVFRRNQPVVQAADTIAKVANDYQDANDGNTTPLPQVININTADSATLVRLKGIGPVTAGKIVARRSKKPFTSVDQLTEAGSISRSTFAILKKHLSVR